MAAIAVALLFIAVAWIVMAPLRIWHVTGADGQEHPDAATWAAYGTGGAVIMGCLMFFSIRSAAKTRAAYAARPPRGRLKVEAGPPMSSPPAAFPFIAAPACGHPNAEPLTNRVALAPVAWFCAECDTPLPREFGDARRSCCGTEPGRSHFGNCPRAVKP
jgi:hypothetical protein